MTEIEAARIMCKAYNAERNRLQHLAGGLVTPDMEHEAYMRAAYRAMRAQDDELLQTAIGTLQPVADLDWHGKWRIKKVIDLLSRHIERGKAS